MLGWQTSRSSIPCHRCCLAQFGMQTGVKLALASTLTGFLFILPLVWYRFQRQSISIGPIRVLFYLGAFLLVSAAWALKLVD